LNGLFRELLGMSCIQYLNEYRVSLAASMLSTSTVPVTTVAVNVGFETLSHFNTTFHRVIGMSPTEYIGRKKKAG
jgi:transcriptional regulator GlxA family with amidase domain